MAGRSRVYIIRVSRLKNDEFGFTDQSSSLFGVLVRAGSFYVEHRVPDMFDSVDGPPVPPSQYDGFPLFQPRTRRARDDSEVTKRKHEDLASLQTLTTATSCIFRYIKMVVVV